MNRGIFFQYVNKESYFARTVHFLSHCPNTGSPWIISGWFYIECIACITVFTYKSSTLFPCYSAELFQAGSDAQCETIRGDLFSYQLYHLLANSLCFWVSFFSHSNPINIYWEAGSLAKSILDGASKAVLWEGVSAPYGNNFWGSRGSQTAFRFHKWPSNNQPWILLIFLESQPFLLAKQMYKFNLSCKI